MPETEHGHVSLKEYLLDRMNQQEKHTNELSELMQKRLEGMNEFREQLNKAEGTFVRRNELDLVLQRFKEDRTAMYSILVALIALIVSIIGIFN